MLFILFFSFERVLWSFTSFSWYFTDLIKCRYFSTEGNFLNVTFYLQYFMNDTLYCLSFNKCPFQFFLYSLVGFPFLLGGMSFAFLKNSYWTINKSSAFSKIFLLQPVACIFGVIWCTYPSRCDLCIYNAFLLPDIVFYHCIFWKVHKTYHIS